MGAKSWVALGHRFTITTSVPVLDVYLQDLFADLPPVNDAKHRYVIDGPDDLGRFVARRDGDDIGPAGEAHRAFALLLWSINRGVIEGARDLVLMHAGGVEIAGNGVLLPGDMEVGKTTLVTGLLRAGAAYLSDEAVGIGFDDDRMRGYAKALSLDPGSWPLFPDLRPIVSEEVEPFLPHQWQVRASSLPGVEVREHAAPGAIVLPRYVPTAPTQVRRLEAAEALPQLAACVFPAHRDRRTTLRRIGRLLDHVPCYQLTYSAIGSGVEVVMALGHGPPADGTFGRLEPRGDADGWSSTDPGSEAELDAVPTPELDVASTPHRLGEQSRVQRSDDAAGIDVAGQIVIHVATTDALYGLNEVGAEIWRHLDGMGTLERLIDQLASASSQQRDAIAPAVLGFVEELLHRGLLTRQLPELQQGSR